ncbi:MAG: VTT domain-containing protein, partial [Candidatus Nanopelagicales bacterium]|nr:VTT domain-containing protein [Candidatus Nanopelagicales bacterium]
MTSTIALLEFLNPETLLNWLGPLAMIGVTLIIFAECGLLIGFFLPGDSLLFITGLFIADNLIDMNIWLAVIILAAAAVTGNLVGYWVGRLIGPKLFDKPDSKLFKREYVDKTHKFFEKYGAPAIILGRFVPIVRTFITAIAGIGKMDFRTYAIYSTIGGVLWAGGVTLLGYFLGGFAIVKDNIEIMLILIVLVSVIPLVIEYLRHRR